MVLLLLRRPLLQILTPPPPSLLPAPHVPNSRTSSAFYPLFRSRRPPIPDVRRTPVDQMPIRPQQVRDSADGGEWQVQQSRARRLTASQLLYPPPAMPVSPKGECVLHYVPYGAFRSSHCSSPTARRPMAPSHAVVRSNARSLEGTCIFIHRLFAPPRTCRGLWSLVQEKGLWCTKWGNGGVWYRRRASGVPIGGEILRYA